MEKVKFAFVLLAVACFQNAHATNECVAPNSKFERAICALVKFEKESEVLDRNLKILVAKTAQNRRPRLQALQLAWVRYRDLQCEFESEHKSRQNPFIYAHCLLEQTKQRNELVRGLLNE